MERLHRLDVEAGPAEVAEVLRHRVVDRVVGADVDPPAVGLGAERPQQDDVLAVLGVADAAPVGGLREWHAGRDGNSRPRRVLGDAAGRPAMVLPTCAPAARVPSPGPSRPVPSSPRCGRWRDPSAPTMPAGGSWSWCWMGRREPSDDEPFEPLGVDALGVPAEQLQAMFVYYDAVGMASALKPWLLRHLLDATGGPVTYLAADAHVFGDLAPLWTPSAAVDFVLVPRLLAPMPADAAWPDEQHVHAAGVIEPGALTVCATDRAARRARRVAGPQSLGCRRRRRRRRCRSALERPPARDGAPRAVHRRWRRGVVPQRARAAAGDRR